MRSPWGPSEQDTVVREVSALSYAWSKETETVVAVVAPRVVGAKRAARREREMAVRCMM